MGCSQSKTASSTAVEAGKGGANGNNNAKGSKQRTRPSSPSKSKSGNRGTGGGDSVSAALYHHLLGGLDPTHGATTTTLRAHTASFWDEARELVASTPALASYVDPNTRGTPLHVACSLGSAQIGSAGASPAPSQSSLVESAVRCLARIVEECPGAVTHVDKHGHVPLEGIFSGMEKAAQSGQRQATAADDVAPAFAFRIEVTKSLLARYNDDPTRGGGDNLAGLRLRGRVLYQIVESLPDDVDEPLGPTVEYVKLLAECGGASARSDHSSGSGAGQGQVGDNDVEDDNVLSLLYRRFVRQFDQSERFFEGDNSRPEVLRHRRQYKNAAVNTFNVIELLLRRAEADESAAAGADLLVHNVVRAGSACPPDLLRYIVETNLEAVAEKDARGNLPLHYAAGYDDVDVTASGVTAAAGNGASKSSASSSPESYSKYVIDELLYAYPHGASAKNADGVLPVVLAIESGKKWIGGGIRSLYEAYPDGIEQAQLGEEHPLLGTMSFQSQAGDDDDVQSVDQSILEDNGGDEEGTILSGVEGGGGRRRKRKQRKKINKDESHDAIMLVQKSGARVRDIVTTMWANEEDGGVQMLGCTALEVAATRAPSVDAVASVALLGVTTVVNAMKNHPNEPAVQEKACSALVAMAPADCVREVSFAASGAISTVVSAMQSHVSDATVQREACRALRGIVAKGGAERATVVASVSGFTALVNSMGAHPGDRDVQREACLAMEVLTSFPDAYLPKLAEHTEVVLNKAAEQFPDDCQAPTNAVFERLHGTNESDD